MPQHSEGVRRVFRLFARVMAERAIFLHSVAVISLAIQDGQEARGVRQGGGPDDIGHGKAFEDPRLLCYNVLAHCGRRVDRAGVWRVGQFA